MKDTLRGILAFGGFILLTFGAPYGISAASNAWQENTRICSDIVIPYTVVKQDDPQQNSGKETVVTKGLAGSARICNNGKGVEKDRFNVVNPVNEQVIVGTKYAPYVAPEHVYTEEVVDQVEVPDWARSVCVDGTTSPSVGSGTCSHHQGVDYYL